MKTSDAARATMPAPKGEPVNAKSEGPAEAKRSPYRGYASRSERNLVETAASAGSFKTLATAIRAAGLVDSLSGKGPFTLFAPTDSAFAKLPKAELDRLLGDKARLSQVLNNHVVPGIAKAPKEGSPRSATAVSGTELKITAKDRGFRVNDARVVNGEIIASNGVIHAIDTVLMAG